MGYNFYLKFDLTGGRLHSVITVFQTVLVESTFLKPAGEAASGSLHSISCQRKTIGPTGPIFSAPLNEMNTEQQKKTGGCYCCGGGKLFTYFKGSISSAYTVHTYVRIYQ